MKKIFIGIIISLFPLGLIGVKKGSNSAVSVEDTAHFPAIDSDNELLPFGYFKNGFTFEDQTTTCTFSSIFPVGGTVSMSGGQLYFATDLFFESGTSFTSSGYYNGNGYSAHFASSILLAQDVFPTTFHNLSITMHDDMNVTGSVWIQGNCVINGQNSSIILGDGGYIIVNPGSSLKLCNITIQGLKGDNLQCSDSDGSIAFNSCGIFLADDFNFAAGSLSFYKDVTISGTRKFVYSSPNVSTIESCSNLCFDVGTTFSYAPSSDRNDLIQFVDRSSILYLNGSSLASTTTGMSLTKGTMIIDGKVNFRTHYSYDDANRTFYSAGFQIGNGSGSGSDLFIKILPGSELNLVRGYLRYNNTVPQSLITYAHTSVIKVNEGAALALDSTLDMGIGLLKVDSTTSIISNEGGSFIGDVQITN